MQHMAVEQARHGAALSTLQATTVPPASSPAPPPPNVVQQMHSYAQNSIMANASRQRLPRMPVTSSPAQLLQSSYLTAVTRSLAVTPETLKRRFDAFQEFSVWYSINMPLLGVLRPPMQASPEDIMLYYEQHWIPTHGETLLNGKLWPAPSTLENNCSLLSVTFEHAGRTGPHSLETGTGNPMQSRALTEYKEGYSRRLRALGYATTSAKHLCREKYIRMLTELSLDQAQRRAVLDWSHRSSVIDFLLVERDLLVLCGAWTTCLRGNDLGRLTQECIQYLTGLSLCPDLLRHGYQVPEGLDYQIAPDGTKTTQRRRSGVIRLSSLSVDQANFCFLRRLQTFLQDCTSCGISPSCYLLRPITPSRRDFKDKPLDSSSLNKRFQELLASMELLSGETLHGVRRGIMQAAFSRGEKADDIGARALQATPAVTQMYLDSSRETYGPVRKHGARRQAARYFP